MDKLQEIQIDMLKAVQQIIRGYLKNMITRKPHICMTNYFKIVLNAPESCDPSLDFGGVTISCIATEIPVAFMPLALRHHAEPQYRWDYTVGVVKVIPGVWHTKNGDGWPDEIDIDEKLTTPRADLAAEKALQLAFEIEVHNAAEAWGDAKAAEAERNAE